MKHASGRLTRPRRLSSLAPRERVRVRVIPPSTQSNVTPRPLSSLAPRERVRVRVVTIPPKADAASKTRSSPPPYTGREAEGGVARRLTAGQTPFLRLSSPRLPMQERGGGEVAHD